MFFFFWFRENGEQREAIKFCFLLGHVVDPMSMAYCKKGALKITRAFERYSRFKRDETCRPTKARRIDNFKIDVLRRLRANV